MHSSYHLKTPSLSPTASRNLSVAKFLVSPLPPLHQMLTLKPLLHSMGTKQYNVVSKSSLTSEALIPSTNNYTAQESFPAFFQGPLLVSRETGDTS